MKDRRTARLAFMLIGLFLQSSFAADKNVRFAEPAGSVSEIIAPTLSRDYVHQTGTDNGTGFDVDHKSNKPGYVLGPMKKPFSLSRGSYRTTYVLRRGNYPKKGFLYTTYDLFRLEIWDTKAGKAIVTRDIQLGDFDGPNAPETRWIEFDIDQDSKLIEPRVYWMGLANGEVKAVTIERYPKIDEQPLEEKAIRLGDLLENGFINNGFVVSRKPDNSPDETGDATTYTGYYACSLAWKYSVTKDTETYNKLARTLQTMLSTLRFDNEKYTLNRYIDEQNTASEKPASKDVYTSFFLASSVAYPYLKQGPLKRQVKSVVEYIGNQFLTDGLQITNGNEKLFDLTPYFTEGEIREGIQKLLNDKKHYKSFMKNLKLVDNILPFGGVWPGSTELLKALKRKDEDHVFEMTIPTLNGSFLILERARNILREQYREDLFPFRTNYLNFPGKKLEGFLTTILNRFPAKKNESRFTHLSDFRVLGSNALLSLSIIKTAAVITNGSQFDEYYKSNLYTQDSLLQTALDWEGIEDQAVRLVSGNREADKDRRGYLSALALINLMQLEKNPDIREHYIELMERLYKSYRFDDNPMFMAFYLLADKKRLERDESNPSADLTKGLVLRDLDLYPEDRNGYAEKFWKEYGEEIGKTFGGGEEDGYSREALPIHARPKDSFLWQRNARRLGGDHNNQYPPTDYLFLYWFCRAHNLLDDSK